MRNTHFLIALLITVPVFAEEIPWPEHPRPDFQRRAWMNLNGEWDFAFDSENVGEKQAWFKPGEHKFDRKIIVPFPWESRLSGIADTEYKGVAWYSRTITLPEGDNWKDRDAWLIIGACDWEAKVWINGRLAKEHIGGYVPFDVNLSPFAKSGEQATIVIRAVDHTDRQQPTGKQIGWYTHNSGIWQTVYLEPRASTYIRSFRVTTDIQAGMVHCTTIVEGPTTGIGFTFDRADLPANGPVGALSAQGTASGGFRQESFKLWSPDSPTLYPLMLTLTDSKGTIDTVESYFGFREVSVADAPGGDYQYIHLNGKPIYLRGALHQSFHPEGIYQYPDDAAARKDYEICKEVGINFLRIHIKAPIPRELYWADKLGILIMQDMPNFWRFSEQAQKWYEEMLPAVIARDFNHPAIFSWVNFNETWGIGHNGGYDASRQEWVKTIFEKTKKLDPTRLVEDNSPCRFDHVVTDINSWHFYINDYAQARDHIQEVVEKTKPGSTFNFVGDRKQDRAPLMNSEYGGISSGLGDQDVSWCFKYLTNELRKHEKICGYIYTELSDIEWEHNGFVNYDRTGKEFGYDDWHPGFSLRDLNDADFVVIDAEPCIVLKPGESRDVAVAISHWSDRKVDDLQLRHRVNFSPETTTGDWQTRPAKWESFRVVSQPSVTLIGPERVDEDRLGALLLELTDGDKVITRNYVNVLIDVPDVRVRVSDARNIQLHFDPGDYSSSDWKEQPSQPIEGIAREKAFAHGAGYFEYVLKIPKEVASGELASITLGAELSSKAADEKLDWPQRKNPASYPQTDGKKWPTNLRISMNGVNAFSAAITDDPADARGVLSHVHEFHPGSYGWWVEVRLSGDDLKKTVQEMREDQLRIRFEVPSDARHRGGLAIFGNKSGRYPRDPRCTLEFVNPHNLPTGLTSDTPVTVRASAK